MSVNANCGHKHPLEDLTFQVNPGLVKDDDPLPPIRSVAVHSLLAYLVTCRDRTTSEFSAVFTTTLTGSDNVYLPVVVKNY